jgi:hypothetical protein
MPDTKPKFEKTELPRAMAERLACDTRSCARWQDEDGSDWIVYYFRWEAKSMQAIMRARIHRPEICLPASGLQQVTGPDMDRFEAGPLELPVQKSTYLAQNRELYVFFCIWQDGDEHREGLLSRARRDRLTMVLEGRRRTGQQTLEIVVAGYASLAEAEQAVRQRLPGLIRLEERPRAATLTSGK